jgi:hypothetical protein
MYIAGFDAKHSVYFDPHTSQKAVLDEGGCDSYFSLPHRLINFADINPSILVGFLILTDEDVKDLMSMLTVCRASPVALTEDVNSRCVILSSTSTLPLDDD